MAEHPTPTRPHDTAFGQAPRAERIHGHPTSSLPALGLAALGIVFGDIGTSPLYTVETILRLSGGKPDPATALGLLSLVVWTLVLIASVKYVAVAMSMGNDGEGGILALMSLVVPRGRRRPVIAVLGLFGAALIYGDGAVTPAISVLSALEGLKLATPAVEPYVLPGAVAVLVALFAAQPLGTERIGRVFGPIMALWFASLAISGVAGIVGHPAVLEALNPLLGLRYIVGSGLTGFLLLGGIFLCVTGAEALYADMGHFGARPIRLAWLGLVFPSLVLNYAGQTALILGGAGADGNVFYRLFPGPLLIPAVVLATLATVIASQAIITGTYSMTRQAIQLGWLPRLAVRQTSEEGYGQIYVGPVNWLMMIVTVSLALGFRSSDRLTSAYGVAVSLTMLMTTALLFVAMREVCHWGRARAGALAAAFLALDLAFFSANLVKVADGGYVPLLVAAVIYGLMWIWHRGSEAVDERLGEDREPATGFLAGLERRRVARVPGTAVFLTRTDLDVPPAMVWHVDRSRSLHRDVLVLTIGTATVPRVASGDQLTIRTLAPNYWRGEALFGFMDDRDIPSLLEDARRESCGLDLDDVTYYVGHASIVRRRDGHGLPGVVERLYAAMERNSQHVGDVLRLPQEQTIEIGRQIPI